MSERNRRRSPPRAISAHLNVPMDVEQWLVEAKKHNVVHETLHHERKYASASKMQDEQYLLIRALWSSFEPVDLHISREVGRYYEEEAEEMLKSSDDWESYKTEIGKGHNLTPSIPHAGMFSFAVYNMRLIYALNDGNAKGEKEEAGESKLVAQDQLLDRIVDHFEKQMARRDGLTPRKRKQTVRFNAATDEQVSAAVGPSTPTKQMIQRFEHMSLGVTDRDYVEPPKKSDEAAANDEAVVNMALVIWLQAMLQLCRDNHIHSTIERATFAFSNNWKALTDGQLSQLGNANNICCILEAKRYNRTPSHVNVRRQEAGEMVCWIYTDQDDQGCYIIEKKEEKIPGSSETKHIKRYKRLLIAQDGNDIWFVVATYDDHYAKYVRHKGTKPDHKTFIYLTEYGPFNVWSMSDMYKAAKFLLAFFLRFNQRQERAEGHHGLSKTDPSTPRSASQKRRLPSRSRSRDQTPE